MLDALLNFFVRGKGNESFEAADFTHDLQLIKLDKVCNVEDSKYIPFLLAFQKRPKSADTPQTLSLKTKTGGVEQVSEEALKHRVKVMQYESVMLKDVKEFRPGQVFQQFTEQNEKGVPRYNLIVRDAENEAQFAQKTMCCFVVPLGAEREMDIHNPERQKEILE